MAEHSNYFQNRNQAPSLAAGSVREWFLNEDGSGSYVDHPLPVTPEMPQVPEVAESKPSKRRITRREFFQGLGAVAAAGGIAALAGPVVEVARNFIPDQEEVAGSFLWTHRVVEGETLSIVTTDLYPKRSGDEDWVNNFIDNSITIVAPADDPRKRDRNTVYPGDLLNIMLVPDEKIPDILYCPVDDKKDLLINDPNCVVDPS